MTLPRLGAIVFVMCAAPRAGVLLWTPPPLRTNYYWEIATNVLASGTYGMGSGATTAIEPLYPFFLAAARLLTGDRFALAMLLQVLLASAAGVVLLRLTERRTGSRSAALAAATCYAFYPYYVRQAIAPHELTLSVVLLTTTAWLFYRTENIRRTALTGLSLGLLLLLRFAFAPVWLGAVSILLLRGRIREAATVVVIPILVWIPWTVRTSSVDGSVVPTRIGENLYLSSCDFAEQVLPFYDIDLMVNYGYESIDVQAVSATVPPDLVERAIDAEMTRRAIGCIRSDPARAVRLKLRNLIYAFAPVLLPAHARIDDADAIVEDGRLRLVNIYPRPWFDRLSHTAAHSILLIGGAIGMVVRRRRLGDDAFLLVIVASIALVHAVFFPTTRLTSPMAVVLMFYTGVTWDRMMRGGLARRRGTIVSKQQ